jgi:hypothetical protein
MSAPLSPLAIRTRPRRYLLGFLLCPVHTKVDPQILMELVKEIESPLMLFSWSYVMTEKESIQKCWNVTVAPGIGACRDRQRPNRALWP